MWLRLPDLADKAEIAARRWATRAAVKAANRERQHTEIKAEQEMREAARLQREATGKLIAQSLQRSQRKPDREEPVAEDDREDSSDDAASEARPRVCPPLKLARSPSNPFESRLLPRLQSTHFRQSAPGM